jgi:hypothetical protein
MKKLLTSGPMVAIAAASVVLTFGWPALRLSSDGVEYRQLAEGHLHSVLEPFAKRVLHPLVVRTLAGLTGTSLDFAFLAIQVACLFIFCLLVVRMIESEQASVQMALPLLLAPAMFHWFSDYYVHDLFYAVLLACYLILLRSRLYSAVVLLALLFLTRESTVLLGLACCFIAWSRSMMRFVLLAIVACAIGVVGISFATAEYAKPNIHGLPEPIYYALKIPNNIAYNVLGIAFWTDTQVMFNRCTPTWKLRIPAKVPLGSIREVGFCGFRPGIPLRTIWSLLSTFGVLPCVLVYAWVRRRTLLKRPSFVPACMLLYASLVALSSATGGNAPERYISYAWPVFTTVTPALLRAITPTHWSASLPFLIWSVGFSGLSLLVPSEDPHPPLVWLALAGFALWAHWITWCYLGSRSRIFTAVDELDPLKLGCGGQRHSQ